MIRRSGFQGRQAVIGLDENNIVFPQPAFGVAIYLIRYQEPKPCLQQSRV